MTRSVRTLSIALLLLAAAGCTGKSDFEVIPVPNETVEDPKPDLQTVPEQSGAALGVSVNVNALKVNVGQTVEVIVTVANVGTAKVQDATPTTPEQLGDGQLTLMQAPDVLAVDLEAGEAKQFSFIFRADVAGSVTFSARANGLDPVTNWPVGADPREATVLVQEPAELMIESVTIAPNVNVGSTFDVTVKVMNMGQSAAMNVTPSAPSFSGAGTAKLVAGAQPASDRIEGGATATFTFLYQAENAGPMVMGFTAAGVDETSDVNLVADEALSNELRIDTPAQLEAMLFLPNSITQGMPFTATLVVTNTGTALAKNVLPNPQLPMTMSVTGNASAQPMGSPVATDIPGGGTASFSWTFMAQGTGSFHFEVGASGMDANSQDQVDAPTVDSGTTTIVPPSALTVSSLTLPGTINRGQQFDLTFSVKNSGGNTINNVLPQPTAPQITALGGANATVVTAPTAKNIAAGQTAQFVYRMQENGTSPGSLAIALGARGVDSVSGNTVSATQIQSNLGVVRTPPALSIDSVTLPARISRGQSFDAKIVVRNTGGADAANVLPSPNPLQLVVTGGAAVTAMNTLSPATIPGGGTATFTVTFKESGTASGTLKLTAGATGTDPALSQPLTAAAVSSAVLTVDEPAKLVVQGFGLPGTIGYGQQFTLTVTVANTGDATATNVLLSPSVPQAVVTGGAVVNTTTAISSVNIPGGQTKVFTYAYTQTGNTAGSVQFKVAAVGKDMNSGASLTAALASSNVASVGPLLGCNGSQLYFGLGDRSLDDDRNDGTVGNDRLRLKEYNALLADYARVINTTPTSMQGQGSTFNVPQARWWNEPIASAVTVYTAYRGAFQGCLTYTASATQYGSAPTTATATTECNNMARKFWSRPATSAETSACVDFAVNKTTSETNARRRWAYTCATMLTAVGFLTE